MHWMIDGYSRKAVHPRLTTSFSGVDDAGATLVHPGDPHTPVWIHVSNEDTNPITVLFKQFSSSTEWLRVRLVTNASITIPGWDVKQLGLEVFAAAAITDNGFSITTAFPGGFDAPI